MFQKSAPSVTARWLMATLAPFLSGAVLAAEAADHSDIIERIAPVGSVCLVGDPCAGSVGVAAVAGGGANQNPEQVYNTYCVACHGSGANNSPIMGDAAAWQPRIDKGMEELYLNAINGYNNNAMPAKGLCMGCTDEEVRATVDYILSALQ